MKREEIHGCSHCVKSFSSPKALYGHMRLHPNRPWRGMQPPTTPAPVESSRPLPCWMVTAKRGRTKTSTTGASSSTSSSGTSSAGSELAVSPSKTRKIKMDPLKSSVSLDSAKNVNCPKKLYRCNSCDKEFTSHQALGGHKSGHNKTTAVFTAVSGLTELQPSQSQRRKVLDIDLNEPAPMDEKDEKEEEAIRF